MLAGSGTADCCAPVICPVNETVWPGSIATSFTLIENDPAPQVVVPAAGGWASGFGSQFVSVKVNINGVLSKSMNTPPVLSLLTVPVTFAMNDDEFEPFIPCGAVKVICNVKGIR